MPKTTVAATQARIRMGADKRIADLLAVAPILTDEQLAKIASILTGAEK